MPFSFGGNKARKAELFFQDLLEKRADTVVTYGSGSSNHCRVVANMAASRGLPCLIISPEEASQPTLNLQLMKVFGAQVETVPAARVHDVIEARLAALRGTGRRPYFIPGGGHGNIGTQAYVQCFDEICAFEQSTGVRFDYIFLASGTGTTQAGLVCGKLLRNSPVQIVGISIARRNPYGRSVVCRSVADYMEAWEYFGGYDEAVEFVDDYTVEGYGSCCAEITETIRRMICGCGIAFNSTYTGKAFWGMQAYLKTKRITGKTILFLHTGGVPLFFDDLERLI